MERGRSRGLLASSRRLRARGSSVVAVRDVLLDTNAYVAFKRGMPEAVEVLTHVPRIWMNSIVLGGLLSGFAVGTREETNPQELQQVLASERGTQLGSDAETAG